MTISAVALESIAGIFISLCTVAVALRFLARKQQDLPYEADDWCMLVALLFFLAYQSCVLALVHIGWVGWGAALPYSTGQLPAVYNKSIQIAVANNILWYCSLALIKASALLLYRRIFCANGTVNRGLNWTIWITLAVLTCWLIVFSFIAGFQCGGSFDGDYIVSNRDTNCKISLDYVFALFITDPILLIWIIILPVPYILRLHLPLKRKILTAGIFMIALVGVAAALVSLADFIQIIYHSNLKIGSEGFNGRLYFCNILETGMMMISINIPVLWPLFSRFKKFARNAASSPSPSTRADDGLTESTEKLSSCQDATLNPSCV